MESGGGERGSEERQMEEFFALISRFREARSRRERELMSEMGIEEEEEEAIRKRSNHSNYSNKKARITKVSTEEEERERERPSYWAPAFQWEDFKQEINGKRPGLVSTVNDKPGDYGTISHNYNCNKEGEDDDLRGLDLNLAL